MSAVTKIEPKEIAVQSDTAAIVNMIERAARDPQVDIDKMERLMQMQERVMDRQARAAYASDLAIMQPKLPIIEKRGKIDIGRGKPQSYALWEDINEAIRPILSEHGFALTFRTGRTENHIVVTGILSHRGGHVEETTMHLPLDTSGSKNAVQAVGSSTSYGKRYTAGALLNLTSRGEDDDANVTGEVISEKQVIELRDMILAANADEKKFCTYMKAATLADIPAKHYQRAMDALKAKLRSAK